MGIGAKRSKGSKSKRQTLRQKYKILRKVKEHHRKKRKEERKLGNKKKEPKDPGIPKQWPFKEELVAQLTAEKEAHAARERLKRDERRRQKETGGRESVVLTAGTIVGVALLPHYLWEAARESGLDVHAAYGGESLRLPQEKEVEAAGGMEHDPAAEAGPELQAVQRAAAKRQREFDRSAAEAAAAGGGFSDSSRRAFFKEFVKVVEASDVIIEVLDARDPLGCRCLDVERFVRRSDPTKKIILLLNKIDLVPREVAEKWLKYLREELPAVAFKCSTQKQGSNLGQKRGGLKPGQAADAALKGAESLGADTLLQLLKNYARNLNLKAAITVGVVGLPNVGKSSLINSLKRTRVAQVGNTPGVTKAVQEVHLDKQVTLLDSPGVVFTTAGADGEAAAALRNCVKVEQLPDPVLPVGEIVRRCPARQLMQLYKVPAFQGADQFLQHVAQARGKLKRGGTVDVQAAAKIVLQDWNDGRIPYYTVPPQRQTEVEGSAALVQQWGQDFNALEVYRQQESAVIAGLPSLEDPSSAFFQTETAGAAHADLEAMQLDGRSADAGAGPSGTDSDEDDSRGGGSDLGNGMEGEDGGGNSSAEEMDEGDGPPAKRARGAGAGAAKQNAVLYAQEGQFNPRAAKAERKRRKKEGADQRQQRGAGDEEGGDSDYDFEADWRAVKTGNAFEHIADAGTSDEDGEEQE
ncbi:hypothetical protein N2152v2_007372 [Parachlorella kessleri]